MAAAAGVSRWTFREALRLLEHSGLVESRRGGGGGLFVAAPMLDAVRNGLSNYLEFVRAEPAEVIATYRALRELALERALPSIGDDVRPRFQHLLTKVTAPNWGESFDATNDAWATILHAAGNPALTLLTTTLLRVVLHAAWYSTLDDRSFHQLMGEMVDANRSLVQSFVDGDAPRAQGANNDLLDGARRLLDASFVGGRLPARPVATERAYRLHPTSRPGKKADVVAREICTIIHAEGWAVGLNLGTEPELMARFGVGRYVMREAIRSLERMGVVAMGRGGASGLKVISPDPDLIVGASRKYLQRVGSRRGDIRQVRLALKAANPTPRGARDAGYDGQVTRLFESILAP